VIEIHALVKKRGGRRVLDGLSMRVERGEVVAVVGPNGAGKSTLLAVVAGVLAPDQGWVAIDGATSGRRRVLGYVPEGADPPGHLTGGELLALAAGLRRAQPLDETLRTLLGTDGLAGQRIDRMSLGQRRRVCLAAALVGAPPALVLDEPDNGLDADGLEALVEIVSRVRARGASVLVATHDPGVRDRLGARTVSLSRA
jgi:ABC-type multidrug transport system ATPase subunit